MGAGAGFQSRLRHDGGVGFFRILDNGDSACLYDHLQSLCPVIIGACQYNPDQSVSVNIGGRFEQDVDGVPGPPDQSLTFKRVR